MTSNTGIVQDCYAAFGRGDIPFILSRCAEDVDWNGSDAPEIPYHGQHRGHDGVVRFFQSVAGALEIKAFEPQAFVASGDDVMTTGRWTCTAKSTGKTFTAAWAMRFVFRNRKIAWFRSYDDTAVETAALRK